jgi:hypothetical protein
MDRSIVDTKFATATHTKPHQAKIDHPFIIYIYIRILQYGNIVGFLPLQILRQQYYWGILMRSFVSLQNRGPTESYVHWFIFHGFQ